MDHIKTLIDACLEEASQKHQIDPVNDKYLNEEHHVEVTLTVEELRNAAEQLNVLRDAAKLNNQIIHDSVVQKQAAWIEWQKGNGAEAA